MAPRGSAIQRIGPRARPQVSHRHGDPVLRLPQVFGHDRHRIRPPETAWGVRSELRVPGGEERWTGKCGLTISRYARGSQITPSRARVEAKTRWAARLKASSRGAGAYRLKKNIHAA